MKMNHVLGGGRSVKMNRVILKKGATGLEAYLDEESPIIIFHVCHSTEIGDVLDLLVEKFPNEFKQWKDEKIREAYRI